MSHFLMKNLSIPKITEEQRKKTLEIQKQKKSIQENPVRKNPMRGKENPKKIIQQVEKKQVEKKQIQKPSVYKKKKISQALREQVWLARFGRVFEHKCYVTWCKNTVTVFDFESGHNIPESKGGKTDLTNLYPICRKCNGSMGDRYSIDEWNSLHTPISEGEEKYNIEENSSKTENSRKRRKGWRRFFCWFT